MKIFGYSPILVAIVGIGVYRWVQGLPIIPTSLNVLSGPGLGDVEGVNAFPTLGAFSAFPNLGDVGAAAPGSVGAKGPAARQMMARPMPYSRLRGFA